jgi:hypothetical protein
VEIEARNIHFLRRLSYVQPVEARQYACV